MSILSHAASQFPTDHVTAYDSLPRIVRGVFVAGCATDRILWLSHSVSIVQDRFEAAGPFGLRTSARSAHDAFSQFENTRFRLRTKTQSFAQNFIGSVGKSSLLTAAGVGRESYPVPASSGEVAQLLSFEGSHLISTPYDVAGLAWNACQARSFILH